MMQHDYLFEVEERRSAGGACSTASAAGLLGGGSAGLVQGLWVTGERRSIRINSVLNAAGRRVRPGELARVCRDDVLHL